MTTQTVRVNDGAVTGTVAWVSPTVYFTPAVPLNPYGLYRVRLTTGLKDAEDSVSLQREYVWEFGWRQVYLPVVLRNR